MSARGGRDLAKKGVLLSSVSFAFMVLLVYLGVVRKELATVGSGKKETG